jgi:hypothetical protein
MEEPGAQEEGDEEIEVDHQARPFGIVVDPGVDFVENLYRTDYSLSDIDMIVVTHDHVDHLGALDPLLSLLHVRFELLSKQQGVGEPRERRPKITVLVSRSVYLRYGDVTRLVGVKSDGDESAEFEFKCFEDLACDPVAGTLDQRQLGDSFPSGFEIAFMSSAAGSEEGKGGHRDLSDCASVGVCFRSTQDSTFDEGPSLAITSDTPRPPQRVAPDGGYEQWHRSWAPALTADVLVVHLSSVPLTELRRLDPIRRLDGTDVGEDVVERIQRDEDERLGEDEEQLRCIREQLQESDPHLQGQIEYAQWLRSHESSTHGDLNADIVGPVPDGWRPPLDHPYLEGLLAWAREYQRARGQRRVRKRGQPGLLVVGELSEELGTMRGKVAARLNERVLNAPVKREPEAVDSGPGFSADGEDPAVEAEVRTSYALTADIGLHVCVDKASRGDADGGSRISVLCTTCSLDTDRVAEERYHVAHEIHEVCVKGENEGIFYNCPEHDPAQGDDPTFLEQLERFDIFGR